MPNPCVIVSAVAARKHTRKISARLRGYDAGHDRARARALAAMPDGEACTMCGQPMYHDTSLDLDHYTPQAHDQAHTDTRRRLVHRSCNRSAGAIMGNRMRARHADSPLPPVW